jgi:hypothetical protein
VVSKFGVVAHMGVLAKSSLRRTPRRTAAGLKHVQLEDTELFADAIPWKDPGEVGDAVIDGSQRGDLYIYTYPELIRFAAARHCAIEAAAHAAVNA